MICDYTLPIVQNVCINELESKLISEVYNIFQDLEKQSSNDIKVIINRKEKVNAMKAQYSLLTEHGSDTQIFIFLHTAKLKLPETTKDLQDTIALQRFPDVFFKNDILVNLSSLGNVSVMENERKVEFNKIKLKSAQTVAQTGKSPKELSFE